MKHLMSKYKKQMLYFCILLLCICLDYLLVYMMSLQGFLPIISVTTGHMTAIAINFILQKLFTFDDAVFKGWSQIIRYLSVVFLVWLINVLVVEACLHFFSLHVILGKLIAQPITFIIGYYSMRYLIFPQKNIEQD